MAEQPQETTEELLRRIADTLKSIDEKTGDIWIRSVGGRRMLRRWLRDKEAARNPGRRTFRQWFTETFVDQPHRRA